MLMKPAFESTEYQRRLEVVRAAMAEKDLYALVIGDPANMNWLTGFDAWSFYVPQVMLVLHDHPPVWLGRQMDAGAVYLTTYLGEESVRPYAEDLVQRDGAHPMEAVAQSIRDFGVAGKRVGFESDVYFFSYKAVETLKETLSDVSWVDADRLVNWCRVIKSADELKVMRKAAQIASRVMTVACEHIAPGVRQNDLVAKILEAQAHGVADASGDLTSICPLILAGKAAATAHPMWTEEPFEANQTVALELSGAHKR
ncbi:MAG: Xaa-Pro peptidase family protein, partial [Gammaproteobacteria bacterium]